MNETSFSELVIVKLVIVTVLLFSLLWVTKFIVKNTPFRRSIKSKLNRIIPILEGLVWFGLILWAIRQLIQDQLWQSLAVVAVLLLVGILLTWFVLRDYLAGIVLKSDGSMKLNDWIKIKELEGRVTYMGNRTMIITADSGESVNIPYTAVSGEISARPNPGEKLISHTFEIKILRQTDAESIITLIRRIILNAPWASVKKTPEIKLLNDLKDYYHFEISIYSIKMVYFQKIKDYLESKLMTTGLQYID